MEVAAMKNGRPAVPRAVQVQFWEGVRSGLGVQEAGAAAGVGPVKAFAWFKQAGGVKSNGPRPGSGRFLSVGEREEIAVGLAREESLREIAGRLGRSPSTISREVRRNSRGRRQYRALAAAGRALRKPRRKDGERRGKIPGMVMISERPAEVQDRAVPGHWEGDLITGAGNKSAIGTLVERSTRFVLLLHLPDGHGADAVAAQMTEVMATLPAALRRSLTWDQGSEMTNHAQVAAATDLEIYFCDPHSPWQRGSNENTNGLLRQYFPKGTDLSVCDRGDLEAAAAELNARPRKTLGWKTPAQALDEVLAAAA